MGDKTGLLSVSQTARKLTEALGFQVTAEKVSVALSRSWFPSECIQQVGTFNLFIEGKMDKTVEAFRQHDKRCRPAKKAAGTLATA